MLDPKGDDIDSVAGHLNPPPVEGWRLYGFDTMNTKTKTIAIAVNQKTRRRSSRSVKLRSVIAPPLRAAPRGNRAVR
jgi:hypothetical protein